MITEETFNLYSEVYRDDFRVKLNENSSEIILRLLKKVPDTWTDLCKSGTCSKRVKIIQSIEQLEKTLELEKNDSELDSGFDWSKITKNTPLKPKNFANSIENQLYGPDDSESSEEENNNNDTDSEPSDNELNDHNIGRFQIGNTPLRF